MYKQEQTPKIIKDILITIITFSLFSALFNKLIAMMIGIGPQEIFALSSWGIHKMMLWQIFTNILVHPAPQSISFSFLSHLAFNMLILWQIGVIILSRFGKKHFIYLYFGIPILISTCIALLVITNNIDIYLAGCSISTYSLLILWGILYADNLIMLFMVIPLKVKSVVMTLIGFSLLVDISQLNLSSAIITFASIVTTYLYAILILNLTTNNNYLHTIESILLNLKSNIQFRTKKYSSSKIFDIKSGQALYDDDLFMNDMLEKINREGKESLTRRERRRMDEIAKKY